MLLLAAGVWTAAGCSPGSHSGPATPSTKQSPKQSSNQASAPGPGAVGLSPGGVTTRVDVPAESTEEEYFQACHAAKMWMDSQPAPDPSTEPYLAMLQAAATGGAGTWNTRWADLTPARQAAVIVAADAAARGECG